MISLMPSKRTLQIALSMLLFAWLMPLTAHQQKHAVTNVLFKSNSNFIEITHKVSLHDAEHAAKKLFGVTMDLLKNPIAQKHFADYVAGAFSLADSDGNPIALTKVGHEIDGRYIWVYQEFPLQDINQLTVSQQLLLEVWPEQSNLVNIERNKQVRSLTFNSDNRVQAIDLTQPKQSNKSQ